jgi:hypothetical protein
MDSGIRRGSSSITQFAMYQSLFRLILPFSLLLACGRSNHTAEMQIMTDSLGSGPAQVMDKSQMRDEEPTGETVERKVIRQGEISFETKDARRTRDFIRVAVEQHGGYLSGDNAYTNGERIDYRVDIRIPADRFDSLLLLISEKAGRIESRNITSQDVTSEFIDVQARIRTKKELEQRYLQLLTKASTVEDILSIERELGNLRSDIESIEGRMKYLSDQVAMSTLTVTFHEKGSTGSAFGHSFAEALRNGWTNILFFLLAIVGYWPFILIGSFTLLGYRRWRRVQKK